MSRTTTIIREAKVKTIKTSSSGRPILPADIGTDLNFRRKIVWFNALGFLYLHLCAIYGLYCMFFCKVATLIWTIVFILVSGMGTTAGAHRYFTHRSFSARWPLRLLLIIGQTIAGQNCMYIWARDHRQHHKFSDTDADPHNATRGFFFSHIGWLMTRKHPLVIEKGKCIDMSDLEADPVIMFQKKYYKILYVCFALCLPIFVPVYFWNEDWINALFFCYFFRYIVILNITWTVNSVAHIYGMRPYDKNIKPVESEFVSAVTLGEGWHNYHHAFPWDYRAAEFGERYGGTTFFIDTMAKLGLAYDLKTTPLNCIKTMAINKGDGSHPVYGQGYEEANVTK